MGTMIFKPVSDIDVSSAGDWELSNSKLTYAAHLLNDDDETISMQGKNNTGSFTIQMALDESTLTAASFSVTCVRARGVYDIGKNATKGQVNFYFNVWPDYPGGDTLDFTLNMATGSTVRDVAYSIDCESYIAGGFEGNSIAGWGPYTLEVSGIHTASTTAKSGAMGVDQFVIEMDYDPLVSYAYIKQNGSWVQCSNVYKKVNGIWVEQSADFLGSSNISSLYYKGG